MNSAIDENLSKDSISFLNSCLEASEDMVINEDKELSSAINKYIEMTTPDLNDSELLERKSELKELFVEAKESGVIDKSELKTVNNIAKVAFRSLVKASRSCYMEKISNPNSSKFFELRKIAERFKRDYELIMKFN